MPGEAGLLAALFARRAPVAALRGPDGVPVAVGRLGAESHTVMLAAFEDYLARTITLIAAALDGAGSPTLPDGAVQSNDYGCAVNGNLAAMVADPEDLVRGRTGDPAVDAQTAAKAVGSYRRQAPTGVGGLKAESAGGKK